MVSLFDTTVFTGDGEVALLNALELTAGLWKGDALFSF